MALSSSYSFKRLLVLAPLLLACIWKTSPTSPAASNSLAAEAFVPQAQVLKSARRKRWQSNRRLPFLLQARPNHDHQDDLHLGLGPEVGRGLDLDPGQLPDTKPAPEEPAKVRAKGPSGTSSHTLLLSLLISLALVFTPVQQAQAGFGPSSGATTSPIPGLVSPRVQEQDLGGRKLKQLIGSSIDGRRLAQFDSQLDEVIVSLKERKANALAESESFVNEQELEKAQALQEQIVNREAMLKKLEAQPYWFNYLAAFVGSVTSTLVVHPVDTIKTRLQLRSALNKNEKDTGEPIVVTLNALPGTPPQDDTPLRERVIRNGSTLVLEEYIELPPEPVAAQTQVLERPSQEEEVETHSIAAHHHLQTADSTNEEQPEEGLFDSLYEGLTGNILKEGPPSALYLGVYESVKYSLVPKTSPEYLLFVYLVAGAAGELVGSVVRAPAEALKSLVQSKSADSALEAAQGILSNPDEQRNVVRAWSSSIWRDVPFGAIQLAIFELIKAYILNNPNIDFDSSTLTAEAIIGACAGGIGAFLTNPADVITTRIITQSTGTDTDEGADKPLGVVGMGQKIYQEGGIGAFFSGWQARVLYWAPSISIFLTCYCSVRQAGVKYDFF